MINRGAEKIHADEVEELILRHPEVADAALVAMPDQVLGESACAYLVLARATPAPDVAALGEFLLGQGLAKYKLPERVEIVETCRSPTSARSPRSCCARTSTASGRSNWPERTGC